MSAFLLSALLLVSAAVLLFWAAYREQSRSRALVIRMGREDVATSPLRGLRDHWFSRVAWKIDPEVPVLLDQLGWRKPAKRAFYFTLQMGVPAAALLVFALLLIAGEMTQAYLLALAAIAGVGFLVPKRLLVHAVNQRKERLATEVSTLIPLLRMLFEVGMTVEQALRVLVRDGGRVLPELSRELRTVLTRVDAGLELGQELKSMAAMLDVDDLTECVVILEQLIQQGGGALASLQSLKRLLDDRRLTTLQEKVSKMSAKMSVVMVACLFPALLIILAGPGFMAVFNALQGFGS